MDSIPWFLPDHFVSFHGTQIENSDGMLLASTVLTSEGDKYEEKCSAFIRCNIAVDGWCGASQRWSSGACATVASKYRTSTVMAS
jgi:hypothetical protein